MPDSSSFQPCGTNAPNFTMGAERTMTLMSAFRVEDLGMDATHPASFARYMLERIIDVVHPARFHCVDGTNDPVRECERYSSLLREHPLDLCCLGVGENGHLAFNDPPFADFDDPVDVKVITLDDASRRQQVG